jgi:hypothetical protein
VNLGIPDLGPSEGKEWGRILKIKYWGIKGFRNLGILNSVDGSMQGLGPRLLFIHSMGIRLYDIWWGDVGFG